MKPHLLTIREHSSEKYTPRTYYNATSADLTFALAIDLTTAGERCTKKAAGDKYLGVEYVHQEEIAIARLLYKDMVRRNAKTLNIAGNGIYTLCKQGLTQRDINRIIYDIISLVHTHWPIEKIYTGGQTGVDIAGAVAGYALEIETEVTLPKGFIQRFEDGKDVKMSEQEVGKQIEGGAAFV